MNYFIFTSGDVNGVGPEISIKTFNRIRSDKNKIIFVCPGNVFYDAVEKFPTECDFRLINNPLEISPDADVIDVIDSGTVPVKIGKPTKSSGQGAFDALKIAFEIVMMFDNAALITAPISKEALKASGIKYPGHTEMLAEWCLADDYAMMFLSEDMKCALATIHTPLKDVPKKIKKENLNALIKTVGASLKKDFKIASPKIALLGLNPHAGENGVIGKEEKEEIVPAIRKNKTAAGPFVPDAFYGMEMFREFDCTIGMYHDQVLIPFKMMNFSSGVNYTCGLPIIRTSPDHGTAYAIAWKNIADETSMVNAYYWAKTILKNRNSK